MTTPTHLSFLLHACMPRYAPTTSDFLSVFDNLHVSMATDTHYKCIIVDDFHHYVEAGTTAEVRIGGMGSVIWM